MAPVEIDGNAITGATIDGTDVQEITVDGDVVFSAAPDGAFAPSGTLLANYPMNEGSGTSVADNTNNEPTFSVSGANWVNNSNFVGGTALDFDGSNDEMDFNGTFSFNNFGQFTDEFSIMFTVDFDSVATDQNILASGPNSTNSTYDRLGFGIGPSDPGELVIIAEGLSGSNTVIGSHSITTGLHRVGFRLDMGSSASVIVDKSVGTNGGNVRRAPVGGTFVGSRNGLHFLNGTIDNIVAYDGVINQTVIDEDFDAQPWTP